MSGGLHSRVFIRALRERRLKAVRGVAAVMAVTLAATISDVAAIPAAPAAAKPAAPAKAACPDERADRVSALVTAKLCNKRVVVTDATSETSQTWAKPDGSLSVQAYLAPVRFKQGDRWVAVDLTLKKAADGSVAPAAHPRGLKLSGAATGAGNHRLASVAVGDDILSMDWGGSLPEPALADNRATYREVQPGIDLVVEATRTGFEQYVVVKDKAAAARVATLKLPLTSKKLRFVNDAPGAFAIRDAAGRAVGRIPTPLAWDSSTDGVTAPRQDKAMAVTSRSRAGAKRPATAGAPGVKAQAADAADGTGAVELELAPDPAWLNAPERVWPVILDPAFTVGPTVDAYIKSGDGSDHSGNNDLQMGYGTPSWVARALLQWDTGYLAGANVKSATLHLWNFYSASCEAREWDLYNVAPFSIPVFWSNQPAWDADRLSYSSETKGLNTTCDDGWVGINAQPFFQKAANAGAGTSYMGLRSHDETNVASFKQFRSSQAPSVVVPYLTMDYDAAPILSNVQAAPTSGGCVTGAGRPYATSATPQLRVNASSENNAQSSVRFEWWVTNGSMIGSTTVNNVPSGSQASVTVPAKAFSEGGTYSWRAQANNGSRLSLWTPWCEFTVDTLKPGAPFVSSAQYPPVSTDPTWGRGGGGQAGQFAFTAPAQSPDVAAFVYQLDSDTAPTTVTLSGSPTTVSITPKEDGRRTLTVRSKDRAGNLSEPTTYVFNAGRAGLSLPQPGANVVKRMKIAVSGDPALTRATLQYRRGPGGVEYDIPLAQVRKANGDPVTAYPVRLSDLGGNAIWNAVDTLGTTGGVVQVRAALYPDADGVAPYQSQWTTVNVDTNGDGAAGDDVGPGSVNLLTGDYTVASGDAEEFGLSVSRTASSREPTDGWVPQGERLTANQQQLSTDTSGYQATFGTATLARSTARGQGSTTDSLEITPAASSGAGSGDSFVSVGGESGILQQGMKPGRRYRMTGWIYVPADTGLNSPFPTRGLRIVGFTRDAAGYHETASAKAAWVDGWQELSVDLDIPAGATEAFFRLYNGLPFGSGKKVYWDNLSLKEVVAPFGPQWRGGAGDGIVDNDYATLTFTTPELAKITLTGGTWLTFAKNAAGQFFPEPGAEDLTLTKVNDSVYRLSDLDGSATEFTQQGGTFAVSSTWTPDTASTSRYLYDVSDNRSLVKRVINPTEPGVGDCATPVPARGCEVLEYDYATATTATGSALGDFTDRVRAIKVWSWDPVAQAETPVEVTRYAYDSQGRLRESWDPRLAQPIKNGYDYDAAGRLTKVTTAGQLPWQFDYGTAVGEDTNPGRLLRAHRGALKPGTRDQLDGELTTSVVYNVPLTRGAGGPHDMDFVAISRWGQKDLPTDATALFGPETDPGTNSAGPATPGNGGYTYATTHYLNASGQEVNTATPGGHIDSDQYDQFGNQVWSLEATNRELALGTLPDAAEKAAELNLPADSAARAQLLATVKRYSNDGLDRVDELGPVVKVALERDLASDNKPTIPAGTEVIARGHTTHVYDEGKPDGAAYHLETTETAGGQVNGYANDADVRVSHTGYGNEKGGRSGWQLKKATSTTTDAGSAYVVYDDAGRALQSWGLGSTGADALATLTSYYTAGAHPMDAACGNRPEWAGQPCTTKAGGPITGQRPDMSGDLPVKRVEEYTRTGETAKVAETLGGKTRRTVTEHDNADRVTSVQITSDEGVALPAITTEYDPITGQTTVTRAGSATITREYDLLGRVLTYTDADGGVTRNEFDRFGKPSKVSDNTGSTTFGYDREAEPRGLLTSVTDSIAGTYSAKYSPDGQMVELKYPGGMTRTDTLNAAFAPVGRSYKRDSDGQVIYAESIVANTQGQWVNHTYTGGSKTYGYDTLGRITSVRQVADGACTTRAYAYDARTNRTAKRTYNPGTDGTCRGDGTADAEEGHTYDSADRITDAGYVYDAFGRTTALPGGLTNTFYANDLVAGQQTADTKQNWTLDPAHRFRGYTTAKLVNGAWSNASSKLNHYGDDSDEARWIVEDTSLGSITRNVSGPDSDLVATTSATGDVRLQLTNLHGDVAATIDTGLTAPEFYSFDEFGMPTAGQAQQRYGWLGGKQRSADALGGVILMGVRLYSPALGRFLQVDPEVGGNSNPYDYCSGDGVNCSDLDGKWGWGSIKKALNTVAKVASYASMIPGPVGTICGVVSAVAYVATGNWKEAAWAIAGAAAAVVGAGAAVKGARIAITAIRASSKMAKFGGRAVKAARTTMRSANSVYRRSVSIARKAANSRIGRVLRGCGRRNSFEPDTPVLMADGSWREIQYLQEGDSVIAVDPETGATSVQPVLGVIIGQGTRHLVGVDIAAGDGSYVEIYATADHPFYVEDGGWTGASNLRTGAVLKTVDGRRRTVGDVRDFGDVAGRTVYNLNVGNVHTFVVGDADAAVVVHNCSEISGYTNHGAEQAATRGISHDMANNAVRTGRRSPGNKPGTTKYTGRRVWVVLNRRCQVVSCGWNGRR